MMHLRFKIMMVLLLGLTAPGLHAQETPELPTNGLIAFVSNHEGNHEIYVIGPQGEGLRNLTNNAARDCCPVWSPDGTLLAFESDRDHPYGDIFVMDADGSHVRNLTNNDAYDGGTSWSPDSTQIAFISSRDHRDGDVFVMSVNGSTMRNLTNGDVLDGFPIWSPDGKKLAFLSSRDSRSQYPGVDIFIMNADGSNVRNLTQNELREFLFGWSPDSKHVLFTVEFGADVFRVNTSGDVVLRNLTNSGEDDWFWFPTWSPDGLYLAYLAQHEDDSPEIVITDTAGKIVRSLNPDDADSLQFTWSPDGQSMAVLDTTYEGGLFVTDIESEDTVQIMAESLTIDSEGPIELAIVLQLDWQPVFAGAD